MIVGYISPTFIKILATSFRLFVFVTFFLCMNNDNSKKKEGLGTRLYTAWIAYTQVLIVVEFDTCCRIKAKKHVACCMLVLVKPVFNLRHLIALNHVNLLLLCLEA